MPDKSTDRLKERTASGDNDVYRSLYDAIVHQHLPPGTKLKEGALSEVFAVSRAIIRPVLARLSHEGMVELHPNRGAFVAKPTPKVTRDLFEVRRFLECSLMIKLAPTLEPSRINTLRRLVKSEQEARMQNETEKRLRLSGEFHLQLAQFSGNEVYQGTLKELVSRTSLAIALYQTPGRSGCHCEDHERIVQCLAEGDGQGAAAVMQEHLDRLQDELQLQFGGNRPLDLKSILRQVHYSQESDARDPLESESS